MASALSRVLLLGPAREAAGLRDDLIDGDTVGEVLGAAVSRYGPAFERVLAISQIWVNGEVASANDVVGRYDEIAVLPPISGG